MLAVVTIVFSSAVALILGIGLIVGFIVMAVLLPIFEMSAINP